MKLADGTVLWGGPAEDGAHLNGLAIHPMVEGITQMIQGRLVPDARIKAAIAAV